MGLVYHCCFVCSLLTLYTICCAGLKDVVIETDIVKLWVQQGGRLNEEINFLSKVQDEANRVRYCILHYFVK
ncbi:unnamed protein product [Angiostrongylus costaricensis]|uniref:Secreted protein n=1 Tax=Angiostrongylus costaricensis TaxID=334426 RepID=A0A0R3PH76_ANGCS|nr:unnamed protein product [Angiostrongylus costaricensis]